MIGELLTTIPYSQLNGHPEQRLPNNINGIHWILWGKEPDFPAALQNATEYLTAHGLG